ncbi:hypothetical protein ScPMuIL_001295 [Solemya velum]
MVVWFGHIGTGSIYIQKEHNMPKLKIFEIGQGEDTPCNEGDADDAGGAVGGAITEIDDPQPGKRTNSEICGVDAEKIRHFFREDLVTLQSNDDINVKFIENIGFDLVLEFTSTSKSASFIEQKIEMLKDKVNNLRDEEILVGEKMSEAIGLLKPCTTGKILFYIDDSRQSGGVFICGEDYMDVVNAKRDFSEKLGLDKAPSSRADRKFKPETQDFSSSARYNDHGIASGSTSGRYSLPTPSGWVFDFTTPAGLKFKCYKHAITSINCDAVVNAANDVMKHGGGVAEAISKAAGSELDRESDDYVRRYKKVTVTNNCVTTGGRMPCKYVIHAVGPKWHDYKQKEDCLKDLCLTVTNFLDQADRRKLKVIVMTAISAGIFGVPKQLCAAMYIRAVTDYSKANPQSSVRELHFVDIKDDMLLEVKKAYEKWRSDPSSVDPDKALQSGNWGQAWTSGNWGGGGSSWQTGTNNSHWKGQSNNKETLYRFQFGKHKKLTVHIYARDITKMSEPEVSAIVSSEDRECGTKGGVSKAIMTAASKGKKGSQYEVSLKEAKKGKGGSRNKFDYGECFVTGGGSLMVKKIIHVISPSVGKSRTDHDLDELYKTVSCLLENINNWNSTPKVAMPLLGTGLIQDDTERLMRCCCVTFEAIKNFVKDTKWLNLKEVHIVNLNDKTNQNLGEEFRTLSRGCQNVNELRDGKKDDENKGANTNQGQDQEWQQVRGRRHHRGGNRVHGRGDDLSQGQHNWGGGAKCKGEHIETVVASSDEENENTEDNSKYWEPASDEDDAKEQEEGSIRTEVPMDTSDTVSPQQDGGKKGNLLITEMNS